MEAFMSFLAALTGIACKCLASSVWKSSSRAFGSIIGSLTNGWYILYGRIDEALMNL